MKIEELRQKIYEFLLEINECSDEDADIVISRLFDIAYWAEDQ